MLVEFLERKCGVSPRPRPPKTRTCPLPATRPMIGRPKAGPVCHVFRIAVSRIGCRRLASHTTNAQRINFSLCKQIYF